jgi:glycosyltransferase involved in cell wall biosynthesis
MNVLMLTNTYLPSICGVARSIVTFADELRRRGHDVLVVAPQYDQPIDDDDEHVVRVPALQNFVTNDVAVRLPIPGYLTSTLASFQPEVVHVHHPFLFGETGLRVAARFDLPVIFTHHTRYELYTHYLRALPVTERFIVRLVTEFANLCDHVVAPSESIAELLRERSVTAPISVIATGVDCRALASGSGARARRRHGIPEDAFVVGHVGRLAEEKNLQFMVRSVRLFLKSKPAAHFLMVGDGPLRESLVMQCESADDAKRIHFSEGKLAGQDLYDAYAAMDVYAFASQSETQGIVLAEAMAAGVPVVAVDATGTRDIVRDGYNGRLLPNEDENAFAAALQWVRDLSPLDRSQLQQGLKATTAEFSTENCARQLEAVYEQARKIRQAAPRDDTAWAALLRGIEEEWAIWRGHARALGYAMFESAEADNTDRPAA